MTKIFILFVCGFFLFFVFVFAAVIASAVRIDHSSIRCVGCSFARLLGLLSLCAATLIKFVFSFVDRCELQTDVVGDLLVVDCFSVDCFVGVACRAVSVAARCRLRNRIEKKIIVFLNFYNFKTNN